MNESPPYFMQATRKQTEDHDSKFYNEEEDLLPEIDIKQYFLSYVKSDAEPITLGSAIETYITKLNSEAEALQKEK